MNKKAFTPVKCNQRLLFSKAKNFTGFTLIELLIVIGIIAILAAGVIVAINPGRQFAQARDATRESHINTLHSGLLSYQVSNNGNLSGLSLPTETTEICNTNLESYDCTDLIDLSILVTDGHLNQIPVDPQATGDGTGYEVAEGSIILVAPLAETRFIGIGMTETEYAGGGGEEETFACGDTFTDNRDGQTYETVEIGTQCWMAENMNYDDGCYSLDDTDWEDGTDSYCRHNEKAGTEEEARDTYGLLYQWSAAMNGSTDEEAQGICPDGWHLPTDEEWKTLEMELGMSQSDADDTSWRYDGDVGAKLKGRDDLWDTDCSNISNWDSGENPEVCHTSGFMALPGSYVYPSGTSYSVGSHAVFWSSSESGDSAWRRSLDHDYSGVYRDANDQASGFSVRCLRD